MRSLMASRTGLSQKQIMKTYSNVLLLGIAKRLPPSRAKNWIVRRTGCNIHPTAFISPDVIIDPMFPEDITILEGVVVGWGAKLFTHLLSPEGFDHKPILLEENCFIGGFTTVRGGCTVGADAIIGSDSLVLKNIPRGGVFVGVPAKDIARRRSDENRRSTQ